MFWYSRQIVYHVKVWNEAYEEAVAKQDDKKIMWLRNCRRFDFTRPPGTIWYDKKIVYLDKFQIIEQAVAEYLCQNQRTLRKGMAPAKQEFCKYELPDRNRVPFDTTQGLSNAWQPFGTVSLSMQEPSFCRRSWGWGLSGRTLNKTEDEVCMLGWNMDDTLGDSGIQPTFNQQTFDKMSTSHKVAIVTEEDPSIGDHSAYIQATGKQGLGRALEAYFTETCGFFYHSTSRQHGTRDDLGLRDRSRTEGESAVGDLIVRPLGADAGYGNNKAVVPEMEFVQGPGGYKVVVRLDVAGDAGFGGADSFMGFLGDKDGLAPSASTENGGSSVYCAEMPNEPLSEGLYTTLTVEDLKTRSRPLYRMWSRPPDWLGGNKDFLPLGELPLPWTDGHSTSRETLLSKWNREKKQTAQGMAIGAQLGQMRLLDTGPKRKDDDFVLGPVPGRKAQKKNLLPSPWKKNPYFEQSELPEYTADLKNPEFWTVAYVTLYDYDDFAIAKDEGDAEFGAFMHKHPLWMHHRDTDELRDGSIHPRTHWNCWRPSSEVEGGEVVVLPVGTEYARLADEFPRDSELPLSSKSGQYRWGDGCFKATRTEVEKCTVRPVGRYWNSWMHDRARFASPSDQTVTTFRAEVEEFEAVFGRFKRESASSNELKRLDELIAVVNEEMCVHAKVVTWFENATLGGIQLLRAIAHCYDRIEMVNCALFKLEKHAEATFKEKKSFAAANLTHIHCVVEAGPQSFRNLREGLFDRARELARRALNILHGLQPMTHTEKTKIPGDDRDGLHIVTSSTLSHFTFKAETPPETATPDEDGYYEYVSNATDYAEQLRVCNASEVKRVDTEVYDHWFFPVKLPVDEKGVATEESKRFLQSVRSSPRAEFHFDGARLKQVLERTLAFFTNQPSSTLGIEEHVGIAEKLAADSLLKAYTAPLTILPPWFVLRSQDERDARAKVVMSVIELANPFSLQIDVLQNYLTRGIQDDDDTGFIPDDLLVNEFIPGGLAAWRASAELSDESTYLVDKITEGVSELIGNMELGIQHKTDWLITRDKANEIRQAYTDISMELANRGRGQTSDLFTGTDMSPGGGEVVGATDQELLFGTYYGKQSENHVFTGAETYREKGAYLRYLYDMVRPLPIGSKSRAELHVAALECGEDVSAYCARMNLGAAALEMPLSFGAFKTFAVANGIEILQENAIPTDPTPVSEWIDTARIRYSMQRNPPVKAPEQPLFDLAEEEFLKTLSTTYDSFVEMEKREVVFAAPLDVRPVLEDNFDLRKDMRFPRGCVPFLGVLDVFV